MKEYNNLINEEIKCLIEKKDDYASEIGEIATYMSFMDDVELGRLDIAAINEKRRKIKAIYNLIEDLEKLCKEV